MKKMLFVAVMLLFTFIANAQADVTKFLGIPIDGTKEEMLAKLREKGFHTSYDMGKDYLEGTFNGSEVYIAPVTNGNKVWRIAVMEKSRVDEGQIRIRFNNLCHQFENNPKYSSLGEKQTLDENEDISYQMIVNKKQYQANFYQLPLNVNKNVWFTISSMYGKFFLIIFYDNGYNKANGEDL
ncbi:MAG: hypothetical protein IJD27_06255 [Alistipes sp.]|nr:hypothetical protein [Alistipes sp.]